MPVKAIRPKHVWTYDCWEDRCQNGTLVRILTVMDAVATSIPADRGIAVLARRFAAHGAPAYMRSDNGRVRDACLNRYVFYAVTAAWVRLEGFRQHYNTERPHRSLSYRSPLEFKRG